MVSKSTLLYEARVDIDGWGKGRQAKYKYFLLESEIEVMCQDGKTQLPCYGIEVIREDLDKGSVCAIVQDRIERVSSYKYKVAQLIKKLYINLVSPVHLIEIAGPFADEWVRDFDSEVNNIAIP